MRLADAKLIFCAWCKQQWRGPNRVEAAMAHARKCSKSPVGEIRRLGVGEPSMDDLMALWRAARRLRG